LARAAAEYDNEDNLVDSPMGRDNRDRADDGKGDNEDDEDAASDSTAGTMARGRFSWAEWPTR